MNIEQENLHNLRSLWQKYGSTALVSQNKETQTNPNNTADKNIQDSNTLHINTHWPNRCWFEKPISLSDFSTLHEVSSSSIFPVWPSLNNKDDNEKITNNLLSPSQIEQLLISNNWHCILEQTAMFLPLTENSIKELSYQEKNSKKLMIKLVKSPQDIQNWIDIVFESFGYTIDYMVIEKLINDPDIQIVLGFYKNQPVASALLYKTKKVIGIHQVGVRLTFQGQGLARSLMTEMILYCIKWQGEYIVLQASQAGKPLYDNLGFIASFGIRSYQKAN